MPRPSLTVAPETLAAPLGNQPLVESIRIPESTPQPTQALTPAPPAMFKRSRQQGQEPSFFERLEAGGAAMAGQLPFGMRMRVAEQEADRREIENQQGWANYQQFMRLTDSTVKKHEADAADSAMNHYTNFKAAWLQTPEAERPALSAWHQRILNVLDPQGAGVLYKSFTADASKHLGTMDMISEFPEWQDLYTQTGPGLLENPAFKRAVVMRGNDYVSDLAGRLAVPDQQLLASGKVTQTKFKEMIQKAATNLDGPGPIKPQKWQFIKQFLTSPEGTTLMAGLGVQLDVAQEIQQKRYAALPKTKKEQEIQFAELLERKQAGEPLTEEDQNKLDVYLGTQAKHRDAVTSNTIMSGAVIVASGGQYKSLEDLPSNAEGAAIAKAANEIVGKTYALGKQQVTLAGPADVSEVDLFVRRGDTVEKVLTPGLTVADKMSGKYGIVLKPKQQEDIAGLETARLQSGEVFNMATKLFTAKDSAGIIRQKAIEFDVRYGGGAARHDPLWKTYTDELDAWAGRFARVLGTERGVMTDKDIDRWVKTFPSASDSADVIKQKIALFNKMRKYVLEVNIKMIMGEMPTGQSKEVRDTINGFLGNAEQLTQKSESKEAAGKELKRRTAAEQLLEKMGAK